MIRPDPDPVAMDLAEDLPRRFPRPAPRTLLDDEEAIRAELVRWGLADAFPADDPPPPPDPRDLHALVWAWIFGLAAIFAPAALALGAALRWSLGLPILGP